MVLDKNKTLRSICGCNDPQHDRKLCVPPATQTVDPRGLGALLFEGMKKHSDKLAQIDSATGKSEKYGEFFTRCVRVAQELTSRGITSEDIVSVCSANSFDNYVPLVAGVMINAKVAPLDPTLSIRDTVHLLNMVKPRIIFCDNQGANLIESSLKETNLQTEIVVFGETEKYVPFSKFIEDHGKDDSFEPTPVKDIDDTAIILFSSGSTGLPKGIKLSHYALIYQLSQNSSPFVSYAITRMYWLSGILMTFASILFGGRSIVSAEFDMKHIFKIINDYKVQFIMTPPLYAFQMIQNAQESVNQDMSSLKVIIILGGAIGETQILQLRKLFPNTLICSAYGITETCGGVARFQITPTDLQLLMSKPISIGKPAAGNCFKVVDVETGKVVGPNIRGELRIKSHHIMSGYYNDSEATAKAFDDEGYYCTGDIAYYDDDYCFYVPERLTNMMKYRSWKIAPAELEEILLTHPEIKEAAVIAINHEIDGDHPMGIVVLQTDSKLTGEDISKYFDARVPEEKRLRGGVKIVDSLPKTPTYKLRRKDLRDLVRQGKI